MALQHFISGQLVEPAPGDSFDSIDPTRPSSVVATVASCDTGALDAAILAAHGAQGPWSSLTGSARAEHLHRWAEAIGRRADELAAAVVREVGKPIGEAKGEVGRCVAILRYYAGEAVREEGSVIPAQVAGALQYSLRRPLGVVGLITPWNFPLAIPLWKAAPALAVGNAVVLKPAESASYTAHLLAQTAMDAALPAGVFNVVLGEGSRLGQSLMEHPLMRGISFTGSDSVGGKVASACAGRNVKFQTEMGGKNVAIVLADADLKQAATLVASGAMRYAGQKCTATSRVVVHRQVREAFVRELAEAINALPVGDPSEAATAIGPVISEASRDRLMEVLSGAQEERLHEGKLVVGEGFFVPPTVFEVSDFRSDLAQKELFGPVLCMAPANDLDHALELANDTRFGLSASLFTKNIGEALKYVERIEAGMVRVNSDTTGVDPHAPFGGVKGSSSGSREQGAAAKDFYTEVKTVEIRA